MNQIIRINSELSYPIEDVLFTFALESEAAKLFDNFPFIICGIGKVNATYHLMKAIQKRKPSLIINLGSAGSNHFHKGDVVCCHQFVQRDMDVRGLGFEQYETPLSGIPPILNYGLSYENLPNGICGTGDSFEMEHAESIYNVVDMEAYALALVAKKEEIPFLCLKYISDGADDNAAEDWTIQVHKAALSFTNVLGLKS